MTTISTGLLPGPAEGPGWRTEHERAYALPSVLRAVHDAGPTAPAAALLRRAVETLRLWRQRAEGRRQLAALDERGLQDIGVTRTDVVREVAKPIWQE